MKQIKFGWDYWNYSRQPEIREIIKKDFSGFSPDYTWQNDSDTLPLFHSNYQPTNAWHNIVPIFDHHIKNSSVVHKDVTDYIKIVIENLEGCRLKHTQKDGYYFEKQSK